MSTDITHWIADRLAIISTEADAAAAATDDLTRANAIATIEAAALAILRVTRTETNACAKIVTRMNSRELHPRYAPQQERFRAIMGDR